MGMPSFWLPRTVRWVLSVEVLLVADVGALDEACPG